MGKKPHKNRKATQTWTRYEAKDGLKRKNQFCPKCGPGVFLAAHKDRKSCGKCAYAEMGAKSS